IIRSACSRDDRFISRLAHPGDDFLPDTSASRTGMADDRISSVRFYFLAHWTAIARRAAAPFRPADSATTLLRRFDQPGGHPHSNHLGIPCDLFAAVARSKHPPAGPVSLVAACHDRGMDGYAGRGFPR